MLTSQASFWSYFGAMNIFTDLALIGLPLYALWKVNMRRGSRLAIIACFSVRAV